MMRCSGKRAAGRGRRRAAVLAGTVLAVALVALPYAHAAEEPGDNTTGSNEVNPQQLPDSSFIYDTTVTDLATADAYFDNQTVQITGEAVGESIAVMGEGGHRWVEVMSTDAATNASVSVFMTTEGVEKIDAFGKYGVTGTILQVRGTYHLVCTEHGGASDLHAESVTVAERGKHYPDTFNSSDFLEGGALVVVGLVILIVFYRLRERQR